MIPMCCWDYAVPVCLINGPLVSLRYRMSWVDGVVSDRETTKYGIYGDCAMSLAQWLVSR